MRVMSDLRGLLTPLPRLTASRGVRDARGAGASLHLITDAYNWKSTQKLARSRLQSRVKRFPNRYQDRSTCGQGGVGSNDSGNQP